jgi:hypothetical protein
VGWESGDAGASTATFVQSVHKQHQPLPTGAAEFCRVGEQTQRMRFTGGLRQLVRQWLVEQIGHLREGSVEEEGCGAR